MITPSTLYRPALGLLTDLYQLTMACAYQRAGVAETRAAFHLTFRSHPFEGGYTVAAGLEHAIDWLERLRFDPEDLEFLAGLRGNDDRPLFDAEFVGRLESFRFACDVDAIPEGTVGHPAEPLLRVIGPVWQCQLVETALLNLINYQTLIATKAARIRQAAGGTQVVEFGLRRAQGIDGGLSATRAAYVGGCDATSNVRAGRLLDIPVRGTHAHSWTMFFDDEREAFRRYATAMPNNAVFLVDTYGTLDGVRNAIEAARALRERGYEMIGIRLDSGDLAYLSIEARAMLDAAGFPAATILASNALDERVIESLRQQGARIDAWGVGTRLVTGHEQSALGGIYKLGAVDADGRWRYRLKLSEQIVKVGYPGVLRARRFVEPGGDVRHGVPLADAIYDEPIGIETPCTIVDPAAFPRRRRIPEDAPHEELLVPVFRDGRAVYRSPPLAEIRARAIGEVARLHPGIRRLVNPHAYPAGLELRLHELRSRLTLQSRGGGEGHP